MCWKVYRFIELVLLGLVMLEPVWHDRNYASVDSTKPSSTSKSSLMSEKGGEPCGPTTSSAQPMVCHTILFVVEVLT